MKKLCISLTDQEVEELKKVMLHTSVVAGRRVTYKDILFTGRDYIKDTLIDIKVGDSNG